MAEFMNDDQDTQNEKETNDVESDAKYIWPHEMKVKSKVPNAKTGYTILPFVLFFAFYCVST